MPKEVKSQPLTEKKAPGKKPAGLGTPPSGPPSTEDAYEKLLSSIPEFSDFGKLFKVLFTFYFTDHFTLFLFCLGNTDFSSFFFFLFLLIISPQHL